MMNRGLNFGELKRPGWTTIFPFAENNTGSEAKKKKGCESMVENHFMFLPPGPIAFNNSR